MRCLLKVSIPVGPGNAAISDGTINKTIDSILAEVKPEAAYFTADNGKRTAFIFLDLKQTSDIPALAEPWFLAFNAEVEIQPVMNAEDLRKAGPGIENAVRTYGRVRQPAAA
jgi:hypothetical protein